MIALASLLVVVLLSLLITRIATVALTLTGLSSESARFQARSALSGVGFTTSEAEAVVTHPVRRRIVMLLMLAGGAGTITVLGTLVLSFANAEPTERGIRLAILVAGLTTLVALARSRWFDRHLSAAIARVLKRFSDLDARDYSALLHLTGDYTVMEIAVQRDDWVTERTLGELRLRDEGVVVLGITRPSGEYVGAPQFETTVHAGDTILAYGREPRLCELDRRRAGPGGDAAHEAAVSEQRAMAGARAD